MSNVVSLCAYRERRTRAARDVPAGADALARAQDSLTRASQAMHGITACLDEMAKRLGKPDPALRASTQQRIGMALERLHQAQADSAELTRLIDAGDIAGCERLRASIRARGEG
jgi:hypothetical protein